MKRTFIILINILIRIRNYFMCWIIAFPWSRRLLNALYNRLTSSQKQNFHQEFAQLFKFSPIHGRNGYWDILFVGRNIRIPLTSDRFWLDWETAVSVVGHDVAIKDTYEALITSLDRPELFIDIGANYGTHSLLFLVHQIEALSFEPNNSCHNYFEQLCEANGVKPSLEPVALGNKQERVTLSYPKHETWLGSTNSEVVGRLSQNHDLVTETVEQRILDDYAPQVNSRRVLIKIDTEGQELSVLQGAVRLLQTSNPVVIFECWQDTERLELFNFFQVNGYQIYATPWNPTDRTQPMDLDQFLSNSANNFIAISL